MNRHFDAIVVGTGQAGPGLAKRLAAAGRKVAVIERDLFGGSCVNYGCTPTKALVASARAAWMARHASEYGVRIDGKIEVDLRAVQERKNAIVRKSRDGLEKSLEETDGITVVRGEACFTGDRAVEVAGETLTAGTVFLDVGSRARKPALPGVDETPYLTSSTLLDLESRPEHLVIVGGSYIGLEFGQMFRRFGSRVTIVEKGPRLLGREDPDVSDAIREILENEGIAVRTSVECVALARRDGGITVSTDCGGEREEVEGSHVLLAVGRVPNTDTLDLDSAGVRSDDRGYVVVDEELRTSAPGVWALGDCNGRGAFTHTSYNDYEIVAANLLDGDPRRVGDRIPCYGVFIDPPLGRVGLTEDEARATGRKVLVGKRAMSGVARAIEKGESQGFMKVLVDAETERILGAAILGVGGDEVVHVLLDVMYADAPYTVISRAVHIHPTVAELLPTLLQDLKEPEEKSPTG